ncbi:AraC family transcriptional regulator [Alicyclobacillus fastidiosus]|uniref:AraC family transcriptional regulator n=1 Tax=Alicyclobacillus fastidiosus TaxID=392011 RepID=A0ABV5AL26_9BACL|nr:AraC family transcriptional regulator [Alicyclobacillus fastidiosus]WEH08861.1 AraC family transcriptional regulator [Alicyclobacillus fastidiosus]
MLRQRSLTTIPDSSYFCLPESVGFYDHEPTHAVNRAEGMLKDFNLHLVTKGSGYVVVGQKSYRVRQGDCFLYFPLRQQTYHSSAEDPWSVRWVHFYGKHLTEFMLDAGVNQSVIWALHQWAALEELFHDLLIETETNTMLRPARLSTLTYAILMEFMHQAVPLTTAKTTNQSDRVTRLLPLMQERATSPFDLAEWADLANVSPHYFCKLFRKTVGMKPLDFVTRCRIQHAKQLLLENREATIKSIATACGYNHISYFNKRFYELEGMTPTEYRALYY